jgi:hypothetical protein
MTRSNINTFKGESDDLEINDGQYKYYSLFYCKYLHIRRPFVELLSDDGRLRTPLTSWRSL